MVRQYIGARYVPLFADPIDWDSTREYEPLTIVRYQGNSYTSKQSVPSGVDILNESYWVETANFNSQLEAYRREVLAFDGRITDVESGLDDVSDDLTTAVININADIAGINRKIDGTDDSWLKSQIQVNAGAIDSLALQVSGTTDSGLKTLINGVADDLATETRARASLGESFDALRDRLVSGLGALATPSFGIRDRFIMGASADSYSTQGFCIFEVGNIMYYAQGVIYTGGSALVIRNPQSNSPVSTISNVAFGHMHGLSYDEENTRIIVDCTANGVASLAYVDVSNPYAPTFGGVETLQVSNAARLCYMADGAYAVLDASYYVWRVSDNTATQYCRLYNLDGALGTVQELSYDSVLGLWVVGCTTPNDVYIYDNDGSRLNVIPIPYYIGHTRAREVEGAAIYDGVLYVNAFDRVDGAAIATLYMYDFYRGTPTPTEYVSIITSEITASTTVNQDTGSLVNPFAGGSTRFALVGDALTYCRNVSNVNLYMEGDEYDWIPTINTHTTVSLRTNEASYKFNKHLTVQSGSIELASSNFVFTAELESSETVGIAINANKSDVYVAQAQSSVVGAYATNRLLQANECDVIARGDIYVPWYAIGSNVAASQTSITNLTSSHSVVNTI